MNIQLLIARTLRIGVSLACIVAFIGGMIYLVRHGSEPFDISLYQSFSYDDPHPESYTTLHGILAGFFSMTAVGWIQTGVLILILTPILRVVLSLVDFLKERDWLYAAISAIVLAIIISNSLEGFK